jgi:hypothetical protein
MFGAWDESLIPGTVARSRDVVGTHRSLPQASVERYQLIADIRDKLINFRRYAEVWTRSGGVPLLVSTGRGSPSFGSRTPKGTPLSYGPPVPLRVVHFDEQQLQFPPHYRERIRREHARSKWHQCGPSEIIPTMPRAKVLSFWNITKNKRLRPAARRWWDALLPTTNLAPDLLGKQRSRSGQSRVHLPVGGEARHDLVRRNRHPFFVEPSVPRSSGCGRRRTTITCR